MIWRCSIALVAVFAALGAEESKLAREGEFWVQTVTGSEAADIGGGASDERSVTAIEIGFKANQA